MDDVGHYLRHRIRLPRRPVVSETEALRGFMDAVPDVRSGLQARTPLRRNGTPDDIASAALFFASPASSWVTGKAARGRRGRHCGIVPQRSARPVSAELRFDGQVVIVTGAAGGIGRPEAVELARRGARVVVNDLGGSGSGVGCDSSIAAAVVDEIVSAGGEAVANTDDLSPKRGHAASSSARSRPGAGSTPSCTIAAILRGAHIENVADADYDDLTTVNLRGTFRTVQAVYRAMKETATPGS